VGKYVQRVSKLIFNLAIGYVDLEGMILFQPGLFLHLQPMSRQPNLMLLGIGFSMRHAYIFAYLAVHIKGPLLIGRKAGIKGILAILVMVMVAKEKSASTLPSSR
jgi:hypothetical protein